MTAHKKTPGDLVIEAGINLLELLTNAPNHRVSRAQAAAALNLTAEQLADVVDCVSTLSDSHSGAHAAIACEDGEIALEGNAGLVGTIRLDLGESTVLSHVLGRLNISDDVRERAADALLPLGRLQPEDSTLGSLPVFGRHYQPLHEAISDGVRCRILYRSAREDAASWRTIDPVRISTEADSAHLIAWDIDRDAQRMYRLDRIAKVELTDDSAEAHDIREEAASESVAKNGAVATVILATDFVPAQLAWTQGLERIPLDDGRVELRVPVASETWLFDRILSSGGAAVLASPADMKERLLAYARSLSRQHRHS